MASSSSYDVVISWLFLVLVLIIIDSGFCQQETASTSSNSGNSVLAVTATATTTENNNNNNEEIPVANRGLQCQAPPLDVMRLLPSGAIVSLSCPDGYDLVGADKTSCDFSGLWSTNGLGYCKYRKVRCDSPEIPRNAFIRDQTTTNTEYLVGNYIQFGCDIGYDLVGNAIIRCSNGPGRTGNLGLWSSPVPECRRNDSPPPMAKTTCNAPTFVPDNAVIEAKTQDFGNNTFGIGGSITYNCKFCYSLSGIKSINCTAGGLWQPNETPICIRTKFGYYLVNRTLVKCGEPGSI